MSDNNDEQNQPPVPQDDQIPTPENTLVADSSSEEDEGPINEETVFVDVEQPPVTFTETHNTSRKPNTGESLDDPIAIVRESYRNMAKILDQQTNLLDEVQKRERKLMETLAKRNKRLEEDMGNPWYRNLMASLEAAQVNESGLRASEREGSDWRQTLEHEGVQLRGGRPKQRLTGGQSNEETLIYLTRKAGVGTPFDTPLYRSGLWVRFKSASLGELTSFQYQLSQMRVELGTQSKGLAFSNVNQTLRSAAIDFCLQYVTDANIHFQTPSDLKSHIALSDADILLWGLACAMFPKGFPYSHSCIADVAKCQHITQEILNVHYLQWADYNALTKKQLKHMVGRFNKVTEEDLATYQKEHTVGTNRIVWFDNGLGAQLKVPNLQEYEDAGRDWIDGIVAMTQGSFNEPPHGSNRNRMINELGIATTARQYSHWVSAIYEIDDDGEESLVTEQDEVINQTLEVIFSEEDHVDQFLTKVSEFIDDGLISMIAIPSFDCPRCDTPIATKFHERFPHLVPLDMLSTFFMLVDRKLR